MLIANDSPLRRLPLALSKRQFLVFDGIRYAAEMADIAHARLKKTLFEVTKIAEVEMVPCVVTASALLDAWAVVDSVNRMRDLLMRGGHGVKHDEWHELFVRKTAVVDTLRNQIQHMESEITRLSQGIGQLWGYLTWAIVPGYGVSPGWYCVTPGSSYVGQQYWVAGHSHQPCTSPLGNVKLRGFSQDLDFDTVLEAVTDCVRTLERRISNGDVHLGDPESTDRRVGDSVIHMVIEYIVANPTGPAPHQA